MEDAAQAVEQFIEQYAPAINDVRDQVAEAIQEVAIAAIGGAGDAVQIVVDVIRGLFS